MSGRHVVVGVDPGDASWLGLLQAGVAGQQLDYVASSAADLASVLPERVDGGRVGVVAVGAAGEPALMAAAGTGGIDALALVGAPLANDAVAVIEAWPELPVLALADAADHAGLRGAVDAYLASDHEASDLIVGAVDDAAARSVVGWLAGRLDQTAHVCDVTLASADGWELHGTRWIPERPRPSPGVVLLHSGRSDRAVFSRLERLLADRGFAVLNLDWRGRGQSTNRGTYMELSGDERAAGWRDAAAAFDHLADNPGVVPDRLAAVGVIHGAEHAVRAALGDPRVRALVILTGYRPADPAETAYLASGRVEVMYVTSSAHTATSASMRALYEATSSRHSRYVEYAGGAIGYQLFELDRRLEPAIVDWLAEVLRP
jgi:dienelactone hydrolase